MTTSSAVRLPISHAVRVGILRGSTEKRFRPVGKTSTRPREGAPDGPGSINFPSSALMNPSNSDVPQTLNWVRSAPRSIPGIDAKSADRSSKTAASKLAPKTCKPSAILISLRSQSHASSVIRRSALSEDPSIPASAISPLSVARSMMASARRRARR